MPHHMRVGAGISPVRKRNVLQSMADGQISRPQPGEPGGLPAPAFLVDDVALDFDLDPAATLVRATLKLRRQAPGPAGAGRPQAGAARHQLDGEPLGDNRYTLDADDAHHPRRAG